MANVFAEDFPDEELANIQAPIGSAGPTSLLEELDARQDELLDELEQLNKQIEKVIAEWGAWRGETGEKGAVAKAA